MAVLNIPGSTLTLLSGRWRCSPRLVYSTYLIRERGNSALVLVPKEEMLDST